MELYFEGLKVNLFLTEGVIAHDITYVGWKLSPYKIISGPNIHPYQIQCRPNHPTFFHGLTLDPDPFIHKPKLSIVWTVNKATS
jgi:hypothetical protein